MDSTILVSLLFFVVALVYSSAGFGGGSLYIAILSGMNTSSGLLRLTALLCNAIVSANGAFRYALAHLIPWKKATPLLLASLPFCIISSMFNLNDPVFYLVLGSALLLASVAIIFQSIGPSSVPLQTSISVSPWLIYPSASIIGALAGITGIGGGVYLAPLLYLTKWGNEKEIASTASLFIVINSIAGLLVLLFYKEERLDSFVLLPLASAAAGGFIGSKLGTSVFSYKAVRFVTIGLLIFAGVRILLSHL